VKVLIDELTIWQFDTFHRSGKYEILYKNNFVTISLSPIRKSKIRFLQWRTWGHFSEGKILVSAPLTPGRYATEHNLYLGSIKQTKDTDVLG
jgi:hypothetical protein